MPQCHSTQTRATKTYTHTHTHTVKKLNIKKQMHVTTQDEEQQK